MSRECIACVAVFAIVAALLFALAAAFLYGALQPYAPPALATIAGFTFLLGCVALLLIGACFRMDDRRP